MSEARELEAFLAIAREASRIAGAVIMPLYEATLTVEFKADRTPVTIADRNAEEAIRRFLERECPGHGVLGEEFGETPGDGRHRWVLDPIDGTKPFLRRVPLFGTLVALERDGEPVVGVIGCHAAGETAYAAMGLGAFVNEQRARVSGCDTLRSDSVAFGRQGAVLCTSSTSMVYRTRRRGFERVMATGAALQTWGDCFGYLMVAAGRADGMIDPEMSTWDAAALFPIIREAGGRITTWEGEERVGGSVVATNGRVHGELLALLAD